LNVSEDSDFDLNLTDTNNYNVSTFPQNPEGFIIEIEIVVFVMSSSLNPSEILVDILAKLFICPHVKPV